MLIKKIKPTKRTVFINEHKFFLDFPEIIQADNQLAIYIDGKVYYVPLPNIHADNSVCHGGGRGINDFWRTTFTQFHIDNFAPGRNINMKYTFYRHWQKHGFDSIKKFLLEMPIDTAQRFIDLSKLPVEEAKAYIEQAFEKNKFEVTNNIEDFLLKNKDVFLELINKDTKYIKLLSPKNQTIKMKFVYIYRETKRILEKWF